MKINFMLIAAFAIALGMVSTGSAFAQSEYCLFMSPANPSDGDEVTITMEIDGCPVWAAPSFETFCFYGGTGGGCFGEDTFDEGSVVFEWEAAVFDTAEPDFVGFWTVGLTEDTGAEPWGEDDGRFWSDNYNPGGWETLYTTGESCMEIPELDISCVPPEPPKDPTNQGPTTVPVGMPVGGVAGLALLIVAGASGGAFAVRKRS
jgi:hypothetical protein